MSDREALLTACFADPADDLAPDICRDWARLIRRLHRCYPQAQSAGIDSELDIFRNPLSRFNDSRRRVPSSCNA